MSSDKSSRESHILGLFRKSARLILKRRGMKQIDLAKAMGEKYKTVNNWFTGSATPSVTVAVRMAECLQVSVDELCGRDPSATKSNERICEYAERIVVLTGGPKTLDAKLRRQKRQDSEKSRRA